MANVAISVFTHEQLKSVVSQFDVVSSTSLPETRKLGEMLAAYRLVRIQIRTLGLNHLSPEDGKKAVALTTSAIRDYETLQTEYLKMSATDDAAEEELRNQVTREWTAFKALGTQILGFYALDTAEARTKMRDAFLIDCPARAEAYGKAIEAIMAFQKTEAAKYVARAEATSASANQLTVILSSIGLLISFGMGWFYSRTLTRSLDNVAREMTAEAEDLTAASTALSRDSTLLSNNASLQASALQETVASVEEVSSMVASNAENAKKSQEVSRVSADVAARGRDVVLEMRKSIDEINGSNGAIAQQIEASNREISEIVGVIAEIGNRTKVINDIVFQTKLLSFNASVEAARAGEHGKGFAVVAEEIGSLAGMSGNASKEISSMLDSSLRRVQEIVAKTTTQVDRLVAVGKEKIAEGIETSDRCGKVLEDIVANVNEVNGLITEIAKASAEQAQGVHEINKAMNELDHSTQENASTSQRAAIASRQLSSQAEGMKRIVDVLTQTVHGGFIAEVVASAPQKAVHLQVVSHFDENSTYTPADARRTA